jgi:cyclopropane fatty-acyl-phospholipid synthase-like methyltransferase
MANAYNDTFYDDQVDGSYKSSVELVPHILELTGARSVLDVGCGLGTWLKTYAQLGVSDYLGLDGTWVQASRLRIPSERFRSVDLMQPPVLPQRFDVAQSLEVAEHLPHSAAAGFVELLTSAADIVVFSAASPHQGGTQHINEQWPAYWRDLFAARGFVLYDMFRPRFWMNENVAWWYAQNMFLYVRRERSAQLPACQALGEGFKYPERAVHPHRIDPTFHAPPGLRSVLRAAPRTLRSAMKQTLSRSPLRGLLPTS